MGSLKQDYTEKQCFNKLLQNDAKESVLVQKHSDTKRC